MYLYFAVPDGAWHQLRLRMVQSGRAIGTSGLRFVRTPSSVSVTSTSGLALCWPVLEHTYTQSSSQFSVSLSLALAFYMSTSLLTRHFFFIDRGPRRAAWTLFRRRASVFPHAVLIIRLVGTQQGRRKGSTKTSCLFDLGKRLARASCTPSSK